MQLESEIYLKLQEAEREAKRTNVRYLSKDVLKSLHEVANRYEKYKRGTTAKPLFRLRAAIRAVLFLKKFKKPIDKYATW